jgi:hypothetical protein
MSITLSHTSPLACSRGSRNIDGSSEVVTESVHHPIISFRTRCISNSLRNTVASLSFRYSGYIIRIPVTFEEMFILRMILTNEIMEAHGCGNNHYLLLHWVTRHPVKYSPLLFQHTKRALYHVANT